MKILNKKNRTVLKNLQNPILLLSAAVVSVTAIRLKDPHISGTYPTCPSLALTGFYCAGCGSMRSMRDITDGKLIEAVGHNIHCH